MADCNRVREPPPPGWCNPLSFPGLCVYRPWRCIQVRFSRTFELTPPAAHAKKLAKIPNLFCVSSVDTLKKAQLLNASRGELIASDSAVEPLGVHVQVNTSGEESKSGAAPGDETVALCRAVEEDCPSLRLLGLMTIGAIARSKATTPENENEDFLCLREQRDLVVRELGLGRELELSMGMSEDFEGAVKLGSGEVRVGSTIFGERGPKSEAKILV